MIELIRCFVELISLVIHPVYMSYYNVQRMNLTTSL